MTKIVLMTEVAADLEQVKRSLDRDLFEELFPKWTLVRVERFDGVSEGDEYALSLGSGPLTGRWSGRICDVRESATEFSYDDVGLVLPPPLTAWRHRHRYLRKPGGGTLIRDEIAFKALHGALELALAPFLRAQFALRKPVLRRRLG